MAEQVDQRSLMMELFRTKLGEFRAELERRIPEITQFEQQIGKMVEAKASELQQLGSEELSQEALNNRIFGANAYTREAMIRLETDLHYCELRDKWKVLSDRNTVLETYIPLLTACLSSLEKVSLYITEAEPLVEAVIKGFRPEVVKVLMLIIGDLGMETYFEVAEQVQTKYAQRSAKLWAHGLRIKKNALMVEGFDNDESMSLLLASMGEKSFSSQVPGKIIEGVTDLAAVKGKKRD